MKTFVIDYQRPDGRKDFKVVRATSADRALEILLAAGIDGWTGFQFREYTILGVTERGA
jgi:hypothetical protein